MESNKASFKFHLLRPYFDLTPIVSGPIMTQGPLLAFNAYEDILEWKPLLGTQRLLSGAFRTNLIHETGLHKYAIHSPLEVPKELRTERWQFLCELSERFHELSIRQQVFVSRLWLYLGFYHLLLQNIPTYTSADLAESEEVTTLGYLRGFAHYLLSLGSPKRFTPTDLERVVSHGMPSSRGHYEASKALLVYHSKVTQNVERVRECHKLMSQFIERPEHDRDSFWYLLVRSAHFRGASYLAFLQNQREDVVREMDEAEKIARQLPSLAKTDAEKTVARDNLHPVLESRMREALWLGDIDLAHARIEEVTKIDPWDSKAKIELGEILWSRGQFAKAACEFDKAARFGPPGTALAYFMSGASYERIGDWERACDAYLSALRVDANGINSMTSLARVAIQLEITPLVEWCKQLAQEMEKRGALTPEDWDALKQSGVISPSAEEVGHDGCS